MQPLNIIIITAIFLIVGLILALAAITVFAFWVISKASKYFGQ